MSTVKVSWDKYLDLSGQSYTSQASLQLAPDDDHGVSNQKEVIKYRLLVLHTELRGLYGDVLPKNKESLETRRLRSAENYAFRHLKEWSPYHRSFAHQIALQTSGVWMPLIAQIIEKIDLGQVI